MKEETAYCCPEDLIGSGFLSHEHSFSQPACLKDVLFEVMRLSGPYSRSLPSSQPNFQVVKATLTSFFLAITLMAFIQDEGLRRGDVVGELFWAALTWGRVDYWVENRGLGRWGVYVVWIAGLGTCGLLLILCGIVIRGYEGASWCFRLFYYSCYSTCVLFHFPSVTLLLLSFSPLFTDSQIVLQVASNEAYIASPTTSLVSIFVYLALLGLSGVYELMICVVEHERRRDCFSAKSSPDLSFVTVVAGDLTAISYVFLSYWHDVLHYVIVALIWGTVAVLQFTRFPHYNPLCTMLELSKSVVLAWTALSVLVTKATGVLMSHVFLILTVSPLLIVLVSSFFTNYQQKSIEYCAAQLSKRSSLYQLEHGFRYYIERCLDAEASPSDLIARANEALLRFSKARKAHKQVAFSILIWEIGFDLLVLEDERLARLRLGLLENSKIALESQFFAYKLRKDLADRSELDEVSFLKMQVLIGEAKTADETLCRNLIEFWSELMTILPKPNKLLTFSSAIHKGIKSAKSKYERLLKEFPKEPKANGLFASFLGDILNLNAKAEELLLKSKTFEKSEQKRRSLPENEWTVRFSDSDSCIIIATASGPQSGTIINCNNNALSALGYDNVPLIGHHIVDIIPPMYQRQHKTFMARFVNTASEPVIKHPILLYLYTAKNYIVECQSRLSVTSIGKEALLLIAFRLTNQKKEIGIVSAGGLIIGHSQGFCELVGAPGSRYTVGELLEDVNEELFNFKATHPHFKRFQLNTTPPSFGIFACSQIGASSMELIFLFGSELHLSQWLHRFRFSSTLQLHKSHVKPVISDSQQHVIAHERHRSIRASLNDPGKLNVSFQDSPQVYSYAMLSIVSRETITITKTKQQDDANSAASIGFSSLSASFSTNTEPMNSELGRNFVRATNRFFKVLRYAVVSTVTFTQFVLSAIGNCLTAVYLSDTIEQSKDNHQVGLMAAARLAALHLYKETRYLTNPSPEIAINTRHILESADNIKFMIDDMRKRLETDGNNAYSDLFTDETTITWEMQDEEMVMVRRNLINALTMLNINALRIYQNESSEPASYFILRNALSETYKNLNTSIAYFLQTNKSITEMEMQQVYPCVIALFLVFAVMSGLIGLILVRIQHKADAMAVALQSYPLEVYTEQKQKLAARLKYVHQVDMEFGLEMPQKPRNPSSFRVWTPTAVVLLAFFSLTSGFYLTLYFEEIDRITNQISHGPVELNEAGLIIGATIETWIWFSEWQIAREHPAELSVHGNCVKVSPEFEMAYASRARSQFQSSLLANIRSSDFDVSPSVLSLYIDTVSPQNCSFFSSGLLNGIANLDHEMWALSTLAVIHFPDKVVACIESLHEFVPGLLDSLQSYDLSKITAIQQFTVGAISAFVAVSAVLLLGVLLAVIECAQEDIRKMWSLLSLLGKNRPFSSSEATLATGQQSYLPPKEWKPSF